MALPNFGTRTSNIEHGPLGFCRVKANFSALVPKHLGGPRPPYLGGSLEPPKKRSACRKQEAFSSQESLRSLLTTKPKRLGSKMRLLGAKYLVFFAERWRRRIAKYASGIIKTNLRQFFMRLSCYWSWISTEHCQSSFLLFAWVCLVEISHHQSRGECM